jgi:hypothetical protein
MPCQTPRFLRNLFIGLALGIFTGRIHMAVAACFQFRGKICTVVGQFDVATGCTLQHWEWDAVRRSGCAFNHPLRR